MTPLPKVLASFTTAVTLLLGATTAAQAAGKFYRWTDAQGHVVYGDQPPPHAKEVNPKAPPPASPAAAPARAVLPVPAAPTDVPQDCQSKRDLLASYRKATKVTETNNLGEVREYSDDDRRRLIEVTEQAVLTACAPT